MKKYFSILIRAQTPENARRRGYIRPAELQMKNRQLCCQLPPYPLITTPSPLPVPDDPPSPPTPTPHDLPDCIKSLYGPNLPHLAGARLRRRVSSGDRCRIAHRAVIVDTEAVEHRDAAGGTARADHGDGVG